MVAYGESADNIPAMSKSQFVLALSAKQKEAKLSIAGLAKAIGVGVQSVSAALKGKSIPNAATSAQYAKFLGIDVAALKALTGKADAAPVAKGKATKAKKAPKAKAAKAVKAVKAVKAAKAVKEVSAASAAECDISDLTIGEIAAMFSDPLAVAVAFAPADKRRIVEAVLSA